MMRKEKEKKKRVVDAPCSSGLLDGEDGDDAKEGMQMTSEFDFFGGVSELFCCVVKVLCVHTEPNWSLPWQRKRQYSSTSSGFIIDKKRIITNAHSVQFASQVKVKRHGTEEKFLAKVLAIGIECDVALLSVEDDSFWTDNIEKDELGNGKHGKKRVRSRATKAKGNSESNGDVRIEINSKIGNRKGSDRKRRKTVDHDNAEMESDKESETMFLEFGELPYLQDTVTVVGYPIGGETVSVTQGVVSRIEVSSYAHGGSDLLAVQIDAAINSGNSGGVSCLSLRISSFTIFNTMYPTEQ